MNSLPCAKVPQPSCGCLEGILALGNRHWIDFGHHRHIAIEAEVLVVDYSLEPSPLFRTLANGVRLLLFRRFTKLARDGEVLTLNLSQGFPVAALNGFQPVLVRRANGPGR
jgi:hypothetical protein